ncbi:MAG: DUF484 family protein [Gammaproteobacteria bacterium]|nr:DUF484 family protein [Gammaproteobacteria bacterium]
MNGNRTPAVTDDDADDEKRFAEYLKQHPDFFQRHQSLLTRLIIPHPTSGRTISLLERRCWRCATSRAPSSAACAT